MTYRELAHTHARANLSQRRTTSESALGVAKHGRCQLVRTLRSTLPRLQRLHASRLQLGVIPVEGCTMEPAGLGKDRNWSQAQVNGQGRPESNPDLVVLLALVDRARRVEQHEHGTVAHDREIRADDLSSLGKQGQAGAKLYLAHVSPELYRSLDSETRENCQNLTSGQEPCIGIPSCWFTDSFLSPAIRTPNCSLVAVDQSCSYRRNPQHLPWEPRGSSGSHSKD